MPHRSPPPPVLGICKAPPVTFSAATTIVVKQKRNEAGTRGRIKATQFDTLSKAILDDAFGRYHDENPEDHNEDNNQRDREDERDEEGGDENR